MLAVHWCQAGKEAYLVYPSISDIPKKIRVSSIKVDAIDFKRGDITSLLKQYRYIADNQVTTIYLSDYPGYYWRYIIYRLAGAKHIIVHNHAPGMRSRPGVVKRLLKKLAYKLPGMSADGIIGATDYVRKRNIEIGCAPEAKCYSAPNGVAEQMDSQAENIKERYKIPVEKKILVTTSRANKYKGIEFALEVLAFLIKDRKVNNLHYLFCGDGPDIDSFRQKAAQLKIEDKVTFAGYVKNVYPLLLSCDMAIHPSNGEVGYSLSILEYMQAGLPVIVPDNPSVCGATLDATDGLIYKEGDVRDAAEKIEQLLDQPELAREMGEQAKKRIADEYMLANTHTKLLEAVASIIK